MSRTHFMWGYFEKLVLKDIIYVLESLFQKLYFASWKYYWKVLNNLFKSFPIVILRKMVILKIFGGWAKILWGCRKEKSPFNPVCNLLLLFLDLIQAFFSFWALACLFTKYYIERKNKEKKKYPVQYDFYFSSKLNNQIYNFFQFLVSDLNLYC